MRLIIVGPGRAGGAVALASQRAGHEIVAVLSRSANDRYGPLVDWGKMLPAADLMLLSVNDDSISSVSERVAPFSEEVAVVAHMSGFVPVTSLHDFASLPTAVGGFHPLQTLPDPERGSVALAGAYVGVGGDPLAVDTLTHFGTSLGLTPFELEDDARPAYHAAAAAAANFVITSLAVSADLFASSGIDERVARPLVEQAIAHLYETGAEESLTGPIARGDIETVIGHLTAAHEVSVEVGDQFRLMAEATAIRAGRAKEVHQWK